MIGFQGFDAGRSKVKSYRPTLRGMNRQLPSSGYAVQKNGGLVKVVLTIQMEESGFQMANSVRNGRRLRQTFGMG